LLTGLGIGGGLLTGGRFLGDLVRGEGIFASSGTTTSPAGTSITPITSFGTTTAADGTRRRRRKNRSRLLHQTQSGSKGIGFGGGAGGIAVAGGGIAGKAPLLFQPLDGLNEAFVGAAGRQFSHRHGGVFGGLRDDEFQLIKDANGQFRVVTTGRNQGIRADDFKVAFQDFNDPSFPPGTTRTYANSGFARGGFSSVPVGTGKNLVQQLAQIAEQKRNATRKPSRRQILAQRRQQANQRRNLLALQRASKRQLLDSDDLLITQFSQLDRNADPQQALKILRNIPSTPDIRLLRSAFGRAFSGQQLLKNILVQNPEFGKNVFGAASRLGLSKFRTGGPVSGSGSGDRVPALLEPGEFVLNRNAVNQVGKNKLDFINNRFKRFQTGGLVEENQVTNRNIRPNRLSPQVTGQGSNVLNESNAITLNQEALISINSMNQSFVAFGNNADRLASALNQFPREISIQAQHNVEVVFNGAEVFNNLGPQFQTMVEGQVKNALNSMLREKFPEVGTLT
jgi:hypothetical protein